MTFLAPWFLLGLLAVSIPLLLHLRRARRKTKLVFSTTQFFDAEFLRSARRARLQDLLLLLLRMAVLAALALALAQPLVRVPGMAGLASIGGGGRQVAIVIDDSASMDAHSPRGRLIDRAKASAKRVVDTLNASAGDRATVVLAGARQAGPRTLFETPTGDFDAVRRAVARITVTDLAGDLDAATQAAAETLGAASGGDAGGTRQVFLFSDFQATGAAPTDALAVEPTVGLLAAPTRPGGGRANLAVEAVQLGAARPMVGVPFTFRALLSNRGGDPREATARLVVDGEPIAEREIELAGGRSRIVRFTHRFDAPGWFGGRVELVTDGGDLIRADNARHFAVRVADRLRALAVNGAPSQVARRDELFFLRLALSVRPTMLEGEAVEALGEGRRVELRAIGADQVSDAVLADYPLVILANVPRLGDGAIETLEHYADRGGSLLITLGDRVDPEAYAAMTGSNRLHGGLLPAKIGPRITPDQAPPDVADAATPDDYPAAITAIDASHPVLSGFEPGALGSLDSVRLEQRYALEPIGMGEQVLMRTADDRPALVSRAFGRGRVMLWASTIDRDWTNFPLEPTFVPWVYRLLGHLGQPAMGRQQFAATGARIAIPASTVAGGSAAVVTPDGETAYARRDERVGGLVFDQTDRAGLYEVRQADADAAAAPRRMFAANVPPPESRPTYLDGPGLKAAVHPRTSLAQVEAAEAAAAAGRRPAQGYGLWDLLLVLALIVGLVEPWIANALSRRRPAAASDALRLRDELPGAPDTRSAA